MVLLRSPFGDYLFLGYLVSTVNEDAWEDPYMNGVLETGAQQTDDLVVDMVSDLICPWCFVAKRRVEKAAAILKKKVEVHWLPFELNADMPVDGLDRRVYRSAKFGSWEESQRLDAQVAAAGAEVGIAFRHDRMKRTPNTFRGHVLLAAALKDSVEMQGKVAERLFQAYFVNGEDVGDPAALLGIAREFGVSAISGVEDLDSPELVAEVRATERRVSAGVRGVPQISFGGRVLASGAQHEELLAASIREIQGTSGRCENGVCTV
jgi:predicted DsbA family dithiol-disulfide isomerase